MDKAFKIFLVDDHKLLRDTLRMFLESTENIHVVGEAGNGAEAVAEISRLHPDVVLMDLTLPDFDGIEATTQILTIQPNIKVIAVTMHPEQLYLLKFLEAGGLGYIHKSAADRDLLKAIEQVQRGEVFLSADGVQVIASKYRSNTSPDFEANPEDTSPEVLSTRERQVLGLLSHGNNCREIGKMLYLSTSTIETYKRRITEKLQITKRADLVEYTIRHKIFEDL